MARGNRDLGALLFKAIRAEVSRIEALHKAHRERWLRARNRSRAVLAKPVLAEGYAALEVPLHSAVGPITEAPISPGPFSPSPEGGAPEVGEAMAQESDEEKASAAP